MADDAAGDAPASQSADCTPSVGQAVVGQSTNKEATSLQEAKEKYEFFWRVESPYCLWHQVNFEVDGHTYTSGEQYTMYQKAVLFGDKEVGEQILGNDDPKFQKKMGRSVKNFDEATWQSERTNIVKRANKAKFAQNPELKEELFATYPKTLVEASPMDTIWGIGLAQDNRKAWNQSTWRGQNLLGFAITEVRDELMKEEGKL